MMGFKFCPMCGEKLTNESFKFCPECGYKFEAVDEPVENNLQESVNEQNKKNPPEEIVEDDGLAKDPKLLKRQLELKKKYGKLSPEEGEKLSQVEDEEKKKEKEELKKWIAENRARLDERETNRQKGLREKKLEEERKRRIELREKKLEEKKNMRKEVGKTPEGNSNCYGAFSCHYSEKRYSTFLGVYPEFFDGVCSIRKNSLVIQGKRKQKVIRFSNISSIEYNKRRIGASEMTLTLSGGNIIHLTAPPEAYNRIYQMWSEGDY